MAVQYVIAELPDGAEGGIALRGAVQRAWSCKAHELMVSGPAETGKTFGLLHRLDALMWKYPGAQAVIARKVLATVYGTVWQTYRKVLTLDKLPEDRWPVRVYGGEKPEWVDYPNRSRLWIAGLDNPGKALSSERDLIYINQAEELELNDWETLLTRATGRAANMPWSQVFGDCNPGPPTHWILSRFDRENRDPNRVFLESRHEDNPTLFNDAGAITERGKKTLMVLDGLTGVRRERLRFGRWVQAEGAIYEDYDSRVHVIEPFEVPSDWRRYRVIDFGYTNPFSCQWWAEDHDGRLYQYRELYGTKRLVEEWAVGRFDEGGHQVFPDNIRDLSAGEEYAATICDHDAEGRATLERHLGIQTVPAWKPQGSVKEGIQFVQTRLKVQPDGRPRIFFVRGARVNEDPELAAARKPTSSLDEITGYVWNPKQVKGQPAKEEPLKLNDHGMDAMRYLVSHVDRGAGGEAEDWTEYL